MERRSLSCDAISRVHVARCPPLHGLIAPRHPLNKVLTKQALSVRDLRPGRPEGPARGTAARGELAEVHPGGRQAQRPR